MPDGGGIWNVTDGLPSDSPSSSSQTQSPVGSLITSVVSVVEPTEMISGHWLPPWY
ncbi:hypothetical protein D3C83_272010 [compost metagenome]